MFQPELLLSPLTTQAADKTWHGRILPVILKPLVYPSVTELQAVPAGNGK